MTNRLRGEDICAYCGYGVLTGVEEPEHVLPAAINGRLTTTAVCVPCNRWAGRHIDQPWLDDPFVGHARFWHRVPDRRGKVLTFDPVLAGTTAEGAHVRMTRDGQPVILNSPVRRDPASGHITILAKDKADLDRLLARERKKAEAAGTSFEVGERQVVSEQPRVEGRVKIVPSQWERMAAKAALGLLAETLPAAWRTGKSAAGLRARMRAADRPIGEVQLGPADFASSFAAPPASVVLIKSLPDHVCAVVSLLGVFAVRLELADDLRDTDLAWVSDPVTPSRSVYGPVARVVAERLGLMWPS